MVFWNVWVIAIVFTYQKGFGLPAFPVSSDHVVFVDHKMKLSNREVENIRNKLRELNEKVKADIGIVDVENTQPIQPIQQFSANINKGPKTISELNEPLSDYFYESDILLTKSQLDSVVQSGNRQKRKAVSDAFSKWPTKSAISYHISGYLAKRTKTIIHAAVDYWQKRTCLKFVQVTARRAHDSLRFIKGSGCYSYVGRIGGPQPISIGTGCEYFGIVAHEIGHALGFFHEQARFDRDEYLTLNVENVWPSRIGNFDKRNMHEMNTYDIPYEYGSLMHYSSDEFAIDKMSPVLIARDALFQQTIGQRLAPTFLDVLEMNRHYQCTELCNGSQTVCNNGGYSNPRNCSECNCPLGFNGPFCDEALSFTNNKTCGAKIIAAEDWKEMNETVGAHSICSWHFMTSPSSRIELQIINLTTECHSGCYHNALQIKASQNVQLTGYRFCCPGDVKNRTVTSALNFALVIAEVSSFLSFKIKYRSVGTDAFTHTTLFHDLDTEANSTVSRTTFSLATPHIETETLTTAASTTSASTFAWPSASTNISMPSRTTESITTTADSVTHLVYTSTSTNAPDSILAATSASTTASTPPSNNSNGTASTSTVIFENQTSQNSAVTHLPTAVSYSASTFLSTSSITSSTVTSSIRASISWLLETTTTSIDSVKAINYSQSTLTLPSLGNATLAIIATSSPSSLNATASSTSENTSTTILPLHTNKGLSNETSYQPAASANITSIASSISTSTIVPFTSTTTLYSVTSPTFSHSISTNDTSLSSSSITLPASLPTTQVDKNQTQPLVVPSIASKLETNGTYPTPAAATLTLGAVTASFYLTSLPSFTTTARTTTTNAAKIKSSFVTTDTVSPSLAAEELRNARKAITPTSFATLQSPFTTASDFTKTWTASTVHTSPSAPAAQPAAALPTAQETSTPNHALQQLTEKPSTFQLDSKLKAAPDASTTTIQATPPPRTVTTQASLASLSLTKNVTLTLPGTGGSTTTSATTTGPKAISTDASWILSEWSDWSNCKLVKCRKSPCPSYGYQHKSRTCSTATDQLCKGLRETFRGCNEKKCFRYRTCCMPSQKLSVKSRKIVCL